MKAGMLSTAAPESGNLAVTFSSQLRDDESLYRFAADAAADLAKMVQSIPRHISVEFGRADDGSLLVRLTDAEGLAKTVTPQSFSGTVPRGELSAPRMR